MSKVVPLAGRRYPIEMLGDLTADIENGKVSSMVVITRDSRGNVHADWSSMKNDELAFASMFLQKIALDAIDEY